MLLINTKALIARSNLGDILLTRNPGGLGRMINWAQMVEGGDRSEFGHTAIVTNNPDTGKKDGTIVESVSQISYQHVSKYVGARVCLMRSRQMTAYRHKKGMKEVKDNIGQAYPYHRLGVHLIDAIRAWTIRKITFGRIGRPWFRHATLMPFDWPVCSELAAQFLFTADVITGLPYGEKQWRGVNPDHFDDLRSSRADLWETAFIGLLVENG